MRSCSDSLPAFWCALRKFYVSFERHVQVRCGNRTSVVPTPSLSCVASLRSWTMQTASITDTSQTMNIGIERQTRQSDKTFASSLSRSLEMRFHAMNSKYILAKNRSSLYNLPVWSTRILLTTTVPIKHFPETQYGLYFHVCPTEVTSGLRAQFRYKYISYVFRREQFCDLPCPSFESDALQTQLTIWETLFPSFVSFVPLKHHVKILHQVAHPLEPNETNPGFLYRVRLELKQKKTC